ncbi:MAG: ROK family protein, partial [Thermoleophilaceae bacterium]
TDGRAKGGKMGPAEVLRLIRGAGTITRAELIAGTGLGRSTVSQRVEALLARQLVRAVGEGPSTGGRPPSTLEFNPNAGLIFAADLGATHSRVALTDLAGEPLAEQSGEIKIADGPDHVLAWVEERFTQLLETTGHPVDHIRAIGIGVPGPVEFATGRPVSPPIMPGWDGYAIPDRLRERYPVPVLVDNDVNIMALGEHSKVWPRCEHLLFVKVGTGIGSGIVAKGEIYRGAQGAAGDIGHIRLSGHDDVVCECGNTGCLEAVAGGRALARELRALGIDAANSRDVVRLVRAHTPDAVRLVRQAGRQLGEALAGLVNALNPNVIVIGGDVAEAHEQLFAGVREAVYQRSTPLATRHLQLVRSSLEDRAGVIGAAVMAIEHILAPDVLDATLSDSQAGPPVASLPRKKAGAR